jgi:lipopolysaccharide/colanic/teichoic acid biosynthesis glycosyltransferase
VVINVLFGPDRDPLYDLSCCKTLMTMLPSAIRHLWVRTTPDSPISGKTVRVRFNHSKAARSLVKRSMDLTGSFFGLLFLLPVLAVVALLIRLDSPGPILFRQRRVGLAGKVFTCLKFRTMVADAERRLLDLESQNEASCGVLFKIKDDPRITTLGRILRRTSLDELPQLWNVLRGEMSLIGPRPLQLRDSERLELLEPDGYARRLSVLPGLSGPWQVAGRSNLGSGPMLELDLDYVENWNIKTDLTLLIKTVLVVLECKGAC